MNRSLVADLKFDLDMLLCVLSALHVIILAEENFFPHGRWLSGESNTKGVLRCLLQI